MRPLARRRLRAWPAPSTQLRVDVGRPAKWWRRRLAGTRRGRAFRSLRSRQIGWNDRQVGVVEESESCGEIGSDVRLDRRFEARRRSLARWDTGRSQADDRLLDGRRAPLRRTGRSYSGRRRHSRAPGPGHGRYARWPWGDDGHWRLLGRPSRRGGRGGRGCACCRGYRPGHRARRRRGHQK
jgi:hypothetical protein